MSKSQRRKGHDFEREIARDFQKIGFPDARRHLEYHSRDANGVDLQGTGPYAVQVKRHKQYAPITAIEEIATLGNIGLRPLLITKADNKPTMAVLPWEDLKELIKKGTE